MGVDYSHTFPTNLLGTADMQSIPVKDLTPELSREMVALHPCSQPAFDSGAEQRMVAVVLLALTGTILQRSRSCCEIHAVAILVSVSQICGLIIPTSSWRPFTALLECLCPFAFRQSDLVCTAGTTLQCKQSWVSGVNGESSFKGDSWAEPTHCYRLSCSSAWWMSGCQEDRLRGQNRDFCTKCFWGKCFSALPIHGFIKISRMEERTQWQQMQACWQKVCFCPLHLLQTLQKSLPCPDISS